MKVSKRFAISAAAVAGIAMAVPTAMATPGNPAGGTGGPAHCTDTTTQQPMDGEITWTPTTLWPPNHKMVAIDITYTDNDGDPAEQTAITVTGVSDNQTTGGIEAPGSGNTGPDWSPTANWATATGSDGTPAKTSVEIRSERSGTAGDRIYTISLQCTEGFTQTLAQTGTATITVTVPHDQGKN